MANDLLSAIEQLLVALETHFSSRGNPQRAPAFAYPVDKAKMLRDEVRDRRFADAERDDVRLMSALLADNPHPLLAEAIREIPALAETAVLLRNVRATLQGKAATSPTTVHVRFLFDKLLARPWFKGTPLLTSSYTRWQYRFYPVSAEDRIALHDAASRSLATSIGAALKTNQQRALDIIAASGPITGRSLARKLGIAHSTLLKHILPDLESHGVRNNKDRKGYFIQKK